MTNNDIEQYLKERNYIIDPHEFTMDVYNTSPQIIDSYYIHSTGLMTIVTPEKSFTFRWNLRKHNTEE